MELKIGELAKRSGCLVETVRYYEKVGLLPPAIRSLGNFRLYDKVHVERLQFIRHCRSLDMTLDEIRSLLQFKDMPERNCAEISTLLEKHIGHVAHRIKELKALQTQLKTLRSMCHETQASKDCGILRGLSGNKIASPSKAGSHGGGCH